MNDQASSTTKAAGSTSGEQTDTQSSTTSEALLKVTSVSAELSADELSKLERDMQTKPANEVKLPPALGGGTLADLQARQQAAHIAQGVEASKAQEAAMTGETSAVLPTKHRVTITADGELITQPLPEPAKPAEPKPIA